VSPTGRLVTPPQHKDPTNHFVEIKRVATRLERCRTPLLAFKRFSFIGHDGSIHPFIVQFHPPTRNVRRDERFMQLTRIFNE
jgi:transformation/transcription domain-associated protein